MIGNFRVRPFKSLKKALSSYLILKPASSYPHQTELGRREQGESGAKIGKSCHNPFFRDSYLFLRKGLKGLRVLKGFLSFRKIGFPNLF